MASTTSPKMVLVSEEELERLRRLEADLPAIVEKVRNETTKERFKDLQSKDTPEKVRDRANKYYMLHKEEINAKRREKRKQQKETSPGV